MIRRSPHPVGGDDARGHRSGPYRRRDPNAVIRGAVRRHLLPNAVALLAGLTVGLIVGSAVAASLSTLVFAWIIALFDNHFEKQQ